MKILLIDNYDSFTFNLYHYLSSLKTNVEVIGATADTNNYVVYTAVKIPNKNIITCFISVIDVRYTGRFGKRFTFEITNDRIALLTKLYFVMR